MAHILITISSFFLFFFFFSFFFLRTSITVSFKRKMIGGYFGYFKSADKGLKKRREKSVIMVDAVLLRADDDLANSCVQAVII